MFSMAKGIRFRKRILAVVVGLTCLGWNGAWAQQTQGLLQEVYSNIGGMQVSDLINHPSFPSQPSSEAILNDFEAPTNVADNYGQRVRGFVLPPQTGDYVFWLASDDGGALFLSTDESPANKVEIATVPGWTTPRQWNRYREQESKPIRLESGRRYYVEALMKEQGGGDNLAVRWRLPDGAIEEPIPNKRLRPVGLGPPEIAEQPRSLTVNEGEAAVFSVSLTRTLGVSFQWQRNGSDIPGANGAEFEIQSASVADNGAVYRVVIVNADGTTISENASLTVRRDTTGPELVSVVNPGGNDLLTVVFSEPVDAATASESGNYSVEPGVSVLEARLTGSGNAVSLRTTTLTPGVDYRLSVKNIRDRADIPNAVAPNSSLTFSWDLDPLPIESLIGKSEPPGPSSRTTGLVITEIHYHPATIGEDSPNLEFVELHNSQQWAEDLGGFRLSGDVDFTFPAGTKIGAGEYLVIAGAPEDVADYYGIQNVLGPWEDGLSNRAGTVRLRHRAGALLLEVEYQDRGEWPVTADGFGHSLTLAKPSFGEGNPEAWRASFLPGGSPGEEEPTQADPYQSIMINEFLAHTDDPVLDFVELYNYSNQSVDLSGCRLADDPEEEGYVFPEGTRISARGFLALDQNALGFSLRSKGEWIALRAPESGRVVDALRFSGQANGVSTGRFPDGARQWSTLTSFTPGQANAPAAMSEVVINELMYHPLSDAEEGEYIELHNPTTGAVDLSGWRLVDEVEYRFPEGSSIPAGGYLAIAKNAAYLTEHYPNLNESNTLGDFSGSLSNNRGRVALERPDLIETLTETGETTQDTIWITVDEVIYHDGGRWGTWADGGGSSLELKDPRSNNRFASNWADSDETEKAEWTTLEHSGRLDNGRGAYDELQILLLGGGECLVDDLFVAEVGGDNRLSNAGFEDGLDGWVIQGNHVRSSWSSPGEGFRSERSLHLRATSGGDNGANRVESDLASRFSNRQNAVIRAKARWLRGHPDILLRIRGNPLELSGRMRVPLNLGTPGAVNSQAKANAGPAIASVSHAPILPQAQEPVQVTAQVFDSDGLANLVLHYRLDGEEEYQTEPMIYRGAGAYTATIPGQTQTRRQNMVAFFVEASDAGSPAATTRFPKNPWNRECLVRFGEEKLDSGFGTYRLWIGNQNLRTWQRREKLSNELIDSTFVYGDFRAVYNARGRFRGSPFIRPRYGNPASSQPTAMIIVFPEDDLFLGANKVNLDGLEQPGRDNTLQRERMSYWIANQMNLPFSHQRYVQFLVNGTRKGQVFTDSQHPSSEYVSTWFPSQRDGELFKIDDWFEFNDAVGREFNENAKLRRYESEGKLKLARYRWSWEKKPNGGLDDDHGSLFDLVEALNTRGAGYETAVNSIVDVEQWMRIFAVRHIVGDWDGYGYNRGKNMFAYKPKDGRWKMILWDLDFSLGGGSHGPTHSMFQVDDPTIGRMYNHPAFRRAYLRAWQDTVDGPLSAEAGSPELDAVYSAFRANGVTAASPSGTKSWIRSRRNYLQRELDRENANFEITTNSGNEFSSRDNLAVLAGTAPVAVKTIQVNGVEYPIHWTTPQSWRMQIPLQNGVNALRLEGFDLRGNKVEGGEDAIRVSFSGERQNPADYLTINELMYNPSIPGAGFIEIYNASKTHSFNLSNYAMRGVDFRFDDSFVIEPEGYAVVASDSSVFSTAYGASIPIAGEFGGRLSNSGETIRLVSEAVDESNSAVIDQVAYEDKPPWPLLADGQGSSLQLVDPSVDNRRVAHWTAVEDSAPTTGPKVLVSMTDGWRYDPSGIDRGNGWREPDFDDGDWTAGQALLYVENDNLPAEKNTPLTIGKPTYYFRKKFSASDVEGMELDAYLIVDDGAVVYLNGVEALRLGMSAGEVSFGTFASRTVTNAEREGPFPISAELLREGENVLAVEVHQTNANSSDVVFGLSLIGTARGGEAATPGRQNSNRREAAELPLLWLNEAQAINRNGIVDGQGEAEPWVEIYNSGGQTLSLGQLYLTSDYGEPTQWKFPDEATIPPGEYRIIWCDGEADATQRDEWHANFRLPAENGSVAIHMRSLRGLEIVDYLNYGDLQPDRSFGAFPNGSPDQRRLFLTPTPGEANEDRVPPLLSVFINEWMADNADFLADPLDGEFDDWFELYNAGNETVDLSGFLLSDDPTNLEKSRIPNGTRMEPKSHLLVWADEKAPQPGEDLRVEFRLSQGGEVLLLATPNGTILDRVEFASQEPNISGGRLPDGSETIATLPAPTPGSANVVNPETNRPPVLSPAPDLFVEEGEVFHFDVSAFANDPDGDDGLLRYEFASPPPEGAQINPNTGEIVWTTSEKDGPGRVVFEVLATDSGNPPQTGTAVYGLQIQEVNLPPMLSDIEDRTLSLGTILNVPLQSSDPDVPVQSLQFALVGQTPAGAFIHPQTKAVIWEPPATGVFLFDVSVTDDGSTPLTTTRSFKVTVISVSEPNRPPVLSPAPDLFVEEGEVFHFDVSAFANDPDGDDGLLRYEFASPPPEGAQINPNTGEIVWTTSEKDGPGRVVFEVLATDSGNPPQTGTAVYGLQIQEVNLPPVLSNIEDRTLSLGTILNVPLQASDPDVPAQSLQFALIGQTPTGAFIHPQTKAVIWEPPATGVFPFEVSVTDDGSTPLTTTRSFEVTVISASERIELILRPAGEKTIAFEWKTERGVRYAVETLSDLNNSQWRRLQTFTADSSLTQFFDAVVEGGQRFYRVRRGGLAD